MKLDGEKVADLIPDEPKKVAVDPGEHLVSASTADGQKWSKVIDAKATGRTVVKVEFVRAAAAAPPAPRSPAQGVGPLLVFADAAIELEIDLCWVKIPAGEFRMGCSSGDKKN